jgi:hypothetical protein
MPELSNIQTFEKLSGDNYRLTLAKFANVLKRIDLWNSEVESAFESFEWKVEDNGFVYSSLTETGFNKTKYSDIPVRPLFMVYTKGLDKTFRDHWIVADLLIDAGLLRDFRTGEFYTETYGFVKSLTKELAKEFCQTGIYFTDEAQDGEDFDGIRMNDPKKLWQFDYAIIPKGLINLYKNKPDSHEIIETNDYFESWFIQRWKAK